MQRQITELIPADVIQEETEYEKFLNKIKVSIDEADEDNLDLINISLYAKFMLDYYYESIGLPTQPRDQLKLCTKFSQALNIDSIFFAA